MKNILDEYIEEMKQDLSFDEMNLKEFQLRLPGLKHKWLSRLIQHSFDKDKFKEAKIKAIKEIVAQIQKESIVKLTDSSAFKQAETHHVIKEIDKKIIENNNIILYLEKAENIWKQVTYDVKNIIEIQKLEQT